MITEAIDRIEAMSRFKSRAPICKAEDGSGRSWLFNYASGVYEELEPWNKKPLKVSNLDSFRDLVARFEEDTEKDAVVTFFAGGARYQPDQDDARIVHVYVRKLSQAWESVMQASNAGRLTHEQFLKTLRSLQSAIVGFDKLWREFKRVQLTAGASLESAPVLTDGQAGSRLELSLTARTGSGPTSASIPSEIPISLPFARGDAFRHDSYLQLDVVSGNEGKGFFFVLSWPDAEVATDFAIRREIESFREATKERRLLVLEDL